MGRQRGYAAMAQTGCERRAIPRTFRRHEAARKSDDYQGTDRLEPGSIRGIQTRASQCVAAFSVTLLGGDRFVLGPSLRRCRSSPPLDTRYCACQLLAALSASAISGAAGACLLAVSWRSWQCPTLTLTSLPARARSRRNVSDINASGIA